MRVYAQLCIQNLFLVRFLFVFFSTHCCVRALCIHFVRTHTTNTMWKWLGTVLWMCRHLGFVLSSLQWYLAVTCMYDTHMNIRLLRTYVLNFWQSNAKLFSGACIYRNGCDAHFHETRQRTRSQNKRNDFVSFNRHFSIRTASKLAHMHCQNNSYLLCIRDEEKRGSRMFDMRKLTQT